MAAQPKEYFDIKTAAKKDSYLIDKNSLAPEVLASKFKKLSGVEKIFYSTLVFAVLIIAVGLLYIKTKTMEVESNTVNLNVKISQQETKNAEYDQQISDLGSGNQLSGIAAKDGMSQNFSNVLKATK
ncbi:cell division protein FtsL [Lactococcus fujiensis]|uniref:Cell division protein n=1 Tax=Lactococcus fujiensis JCM 16395 TaxID=1291764 RepID=A0A2A5RIX4_9LACT|nr:cell division protein FtsL [Lactococcus fujiensis]PCR99027.1 cell division protein [Lactococcus fujiensis JCM 16395]